MDSQSILEQELKTFSWNEVDQYPSFESCEDIINFNENKICFSIPFYGRFYQCPRNSMDDLGRGC